VETQEYSSHVISGSKLHAAHVVRWSETCLGLLLTDGDFTKWRQAMRTHGLNPVACYVSFELVRSRFTPHCRLVQGRYLPDDTVQFRKFDYIVANRGAGEQ